MSSWIQEIRFGFRMLRKSPEITAVAVLAMAIAIGATTTIFSVVNGVLLEPLPFDDTDSMVGIWEIDPARPDAWSTTAAATYVAWRDRSTAFSSVASARNRSFTLSSFEDGDTPLMRQVSHNYFDLLGVQPFLGRSFRLEDDAPGASPTVIVSYELWQRRFGSDPDAVGQTTELDDVAHEIVGVMPQGFDNPIFGLVDSPQAWLPYRYGTTGLNRQDNGHLVIACLASGTSLEQAQVDMDRLSVELQKEFPETHDRVAARVTPIKERMVRNARPGLLMLFGAVVFVLLVACGNVANLLLARALTRQREMSLRRALGANLGHLSRQLVVESLLLTTIGAGFGLLLAVWGTQAIGLLIPEGFNVPAAAFEIDSRVLLFTLGLAVLTGTLFGLLPASIALRSDLDSDLGSGTQRTTASGRSQRLRNVLVIAEVALSLVLLIAAGLMVRSFLRLEGLNPGFDARNVLTFRVSTRGENYQDPASRVRFFERVTEELATIPGVKAASATRALPIFAQFGDLPVTLDADPAPEPGSEARVAVRRIVPGFLDAFGVPMLKGRALSRRDDADAAPVVVISKTMARQMWGSRDPIGESITLMDGQGISRQVVGVAGDVRSDGAPPDPLPVVYLPIAQDAAPVTSMGYIVRTEGPPMAVLEAARAKVRAVDRGMPVYLARTLDQQIRILDWQSRFLMSLLALFAVLALALATTGIYGVLSYSVSKRSREIGIRMALGARRKDVVTMVLRGGLSLAVAGIIGGLVGALGFSQILANQLYGVSATDPLTYLTLALCLALTAVAASVIPALRATRVDPAATLWQD